jgi:hypothetical protein
MGGWEEECYYSLFRIALISIAQQKEWPVIQQKLLDAYDYRPCRAEPLHIIARSLRMMGRVRAAYMFAKEAAQIPYPQHDILFIDTNVYKWMALDEMASSAFYVHDYKSGYAVCEKLLRENLLPQSEITRVRTNFEAYRQKLAEMEAMQRQYAQQMQQMQQQMQQQKPQPVLVPSTPKSAYIPPRATRFKERKK